MIGKSVLRREDLRLVRGEGRYADDLWFDNAAHAVFARSPYSHARILKIDATAAGSVPGVLAVLTGADLLDGGLGPIPHQLGSSKTGADVPLINRYGSERARTPHRALPTDKVRFVGEAYAAVIAES